MRQINVLLIEDEVLIQKSLTKMMELRGAMVRAESYGREAIKLILNNDFDRIICDLMLQDVSGFDVLEESKIKYTSEELSKKFVIITAYSSENVLQKASQYGCRVISKPFQNINETIDTLLEVDS
jgi:DNA-binding NarL/FixJ family response regulator